MGPWLLRNNYALLLEEYEGFQNPRSIVLDKQAVWAQVMHLLDNYMKEHGIEACADLWGGNGGSGEATN
jgi:hypothetical protein